MPALIRNLDDNNAIIAMVDSNLQHREKLLCSEKAWAYKMKLDALKHKGIKSDSHSADKISAQTGDNKVDLRELAFNTAVELTYLDYDEQFAVLDAMAKYEVKPTLSQAVRLKKMKQAGTALSLNKTELTS